MGLSVVRTAIEGHVGRDRAPTIIFEALSELPEGEDIPRGPGALAAFITGPLAATLERHLGPESAAAAVASVQSGLAMAMMGLAPAPVPIDIEVSISDSDWPDVDVDEASENDEDRENDENVRTKSKRPTLSISREMYEDQDTVPIVVVARTSRLAQRIRTAFGGHRIEIALSSERDDFAEQLDSLTPEIVIVDGLDAPDLRPQELADLVVSAPVATLTLIWASDQPWGSAAVGSLERVGATFAKVPRSASVDTMLDYIRARLA